ncbi:Fc.00g057200.m01.CDS01 [Cosmosporella sp. VM-42]
MACVASTAVVVRFAFVEDFDNPDFLCVNPLKTKIETFELWIANMYQMPRLILQYGQLRSKA